jgi:hypothetical protein
MGRKPFENFAHQRARLQRLSDARFFSGWLFSGNAERLEMVVQGASAIAHGDAFFCHLSGGDQDAYFTAAVEATGAATPSAELGGEARLCRLKVLGKIEYRGSVEEVRRLAQGVSIRLLTPSGRLETAVADVSPSGVGVLVAQELPKGAEVDLELDLPTGSFRCSGKVIYCRKLKGLTGFYRVGFSLGQLDRLNRNHWNRLFSQVA